MVEGRNDSGLYRPARLSGKVLRLHFAREPQLRPYLEIATAEGELYVQIRLKPGDQAVEVSLGKERGGDAVTAALRLFMGRPP